MIWQQYLTMGSAFLSIIGSFSQSTMINRIITATAVVFGQYVLYSGGWYNVY